MRGGAPGGRDRRRLERSPARPPTRSSTASRPMPPIRERVGAARAGWRCSSTATPTPRCPLGSGPSATTCSRSPSTSGRCRSTPGRLGGWWRRSPRAPSSAAHVHLRTRPAGTSSPWPGGHRHDRGRASMPSSPVGSRPSASARCPAAQAHALGVAEPVSPQHHPARGHGGRRACPTGPPTGTSCTSAGTRSWCRAGWWPSATTRPTELADRERAVLQVLLRRPGVVVAKSALGREVWGPGARRPHHRGHGRPAAEAARGRLGPAVETVVRRGYHVQVG